MSDYSINSISTVRPADAGVSPYRQGPGQVDPAGMKAPNTGIGEPPAAKAGAPAPSDPTALKPGAPAQPEPAAPKPATPVTRGDNVSIHFRVDRQTNAVTVFIVDRVSKRVLRSIPPEEVGKLQAGDLIELTG